MTAPPRRCGRLVPSKRGDRHPDQCHRPKASAASTNNTCPSSTSQHLTATYTTLSTNECSLGNGNHWITTRRIMDSRQCIVEIAFFVLTLNAIGFQPICSSFAACQSVHLLWFVGCIEKRTSCRVSHERIGDSLSLTMASKMPATTFSVCRNSLNYRRSLPSLSLEVVVV